MDHQRKKYFFPKRKKKEGNANKEKNCSTVFNNCTKQEKNHQKTIDDDMVLSWKLFFPDEEYNGSSNRLKKVRAIQKLLNKQNVTCTIERLESGIPFDIDVLKLYDDNDFLCDWPDFVLNLTEDSTTTLNCIKMAIQQKCLENFLLKNHNIAALQCQDNNLPLVKLRILNHQPIVPLRDLKMNSYGKLISTKGCVIRVARVKHVAQTFVFACMKCGMLKCVRQIHGNFTKPRKCSLCTTSKFRLVLDSPSVKSVPCQVIKIQEPLNDDQENKGRMPRTLIVQLEDDLVNTCMPGDDVLLIGIMKLLGTNEGQNKPNAASNSFSLYMEAVTLINAKHRVESNSIDNEMSIKDYLAIKEIYNEPDIFSLLVHSLCPSIYGHEMIKAGLILGLFGGNNDNNDSPSRSAIHVLIVGDPGLGKSQMLQACARVAVKGIYTCGNSTTSSGLMVTLTKEAGSNDFALEPGALVLADGGCCCIDEFDKMPTHQHSALLECMEQQTVSLAKSGIVCSLPAKAGILAAANPIGGRYDRGKTMLQNLKMSEPLLSRFDLVFLLLDQPDKHLDDLLCKHVMTMHNGRESVQKLEHVTNSNGNPSVGTPPSTLGERLLASLSSKRHADIIPPSILRKYISYAKRYVNPILSEDAAKILHDYYLEIRAMGKIHQLPVSTRQLEAMIRLTEARARLELRTEATGNDALDIVQLLRYTTMNSDTTLDLSGVPKNFFPINCSQQTGRSSGGKMQSFLRLLRKISNTTLQRRFTNTELKEVALRSGVTAPEFTQFIFKLNEQGILLKTGNDSYKFVSE